MLNPNLHSYMVQVKPEIWKVFKAKCQNEGRSMASVIRELIDNYLKKG